jgi:hypothetical protein
MRRPRAFALAALLGAISANAQAEKPPQPDKPAQHNPGAKPAPAGKPAHAATPALPEPARERGNDGREPVDVARSAPGKSEKAHERAPGQSPDARDKRSDALDAAPGQSDAQADEPMRMKRRQERRAALNERYGLELLQRPPIRAELERHAWRMARLERMRALALAMTNTAKQKKTLERLDQLAAKENARHERHMDHLKNQANTVTAAQATKPADKPVAQAEAASERADKSGGGR